MTNFEGFGLSPALAHALARMNYKTPTPIQAQAIPLALEGRDIMGSAQTGTGKTAAFAIPVVEKLLRSPRGSALVLTPTRELGKQVMDIMKQLLGRDSAIKTAFLIGGQSMHKQYAQIKQRPRLIVGTPGRINDHLERGSLILFDADMLVLDETDRMLDMGFSVQIDRILKYLPPKRQTMMFSATLPKNIVALSENYLVNPARIAVGSTTDPAKNIKQEVMKVAASDKYGTLVAELGGRDGSIVVFVKTKHGTERLAKKLSRQNFEADAIHGGLKQSRRDRVIKAFRNKEYRILIATDVAARGLDIPHIEHVINYDLPQVPEDYIHRIGRTARAGAKGAALCLVTPEDGRKWRAIERLIDPDSDHNDNKGGGKKKKSGKPRRSGRRKSGGGRNFSGPGGKRSNGMRKQKNQRSGHRNNSQKKKATQAA